MKQKDHLKTGCLTQQAWKHLYVIIAVCVGQLLLALPAYAQDWTVKGKVTSSASSEDLAGVVINVKGTNIGTATEVDGKYSLTFPETYKDSTLVFNFIDYKTQEVKIASQTEINVQLEPDNVMEEVVVIGYGTQEKSDVTGAISKVEAKDLQQTAVFSAEQAMQGRAAGVTVIQNTGAPGSGVNVRVRGIGTVGNSNPLYVVDGLPIPVENIDFLNPNDIASVEILKDASAAAIYGARAANGVVLVTTGQGKKGKNVVNFNTYSGVQNAWKTYDLLNAREWATLKNEAAANDGSPAVFSNPDSLGAGTDWQKEIFRKAYIANYNLSASGGNDKTTYYISGTYFTQQGIIKKSDYNRYTFRINLRHQFSKRLAFGNNLDLTYSKRNIILEANEFLSPLNNAFTIDPVTPVRNPDGTYASSPYNDRRNPVAQLDFTNQVAKNYLGAGNIYGEFEIIEGLKWRSSFGAYKSFLNRANFTPTYNLGPDEQNLISIVERQDDELTTTVWEHSLNYQKTFAKKHTIGALALFGSQSTRGEMFKASKSNTPTNSPSNQYLDAATSTSASASGNATEWALLSYMGRVNYEFANKYLITATVRVDGSSRFAKNNRYGTFPSIAAGWKITEEEFMKSVNWLSFLKLRASWGRLGNQNIFGGDYPYTTTVASGQSYSFNGVKTNGSAPLSAGNEKIKWETVTITNIGLDWGFLKNRITLTTEYYIKKTTDMLVRAPIPLSVGLQTAPYVNGGSVRNSGLEIAAAYNKSEGRFQFTAGANVTFLKNEVLSLGTGGAPIYSGDFRNIGTATKTAVGQPIASFYGYQTAGIFQNQAQIDASAQPTAKPGDVIFVDRDNNGIIDDKDQTYIGNAIPKFIYGINGSASFMNFDLNVFFQGSNGNKLFNGNKYYVEGGSLYTNERTTMLGRWTGPGSSTDIPRLTEDDPNQNKRISDRYIESGSYLRLKVLQLGYTFPEAWGGNVISKFRVYVAAQNLFTITNYSGLDPEIGLGGTGLGDVGNNSLEQGLDRGTYPQARTFLLGVNLTF